MKPTHFPIALAAELALRPETNLEFAQIVGIPAPNLSILARSGPHARQCGPTQLSKILSGLDPDARARLVCAWLRDQVPPEIGPGDVTICPNTGRILETRDEEPWPDIDPDFRDCTLYVLKRARTCPEIREIITNLAAALRGHKK